MIDAADTAGAFLMTACRLNSNRRMARLSMRIREDQISGPRVFLPDCSFQSDADKHRQNLPGPPQPRDSADRAQDRHAIGAVG